MSQAQEAADAEEARKCDSDIFTALGRLDVGAVRHILRTVPGAATKKDDIDRTALHCAAWHGRVKVGQLLLAARADVDAKDRYGRTPLHTAACWGKADVVTLLLEAKASVTAKNNLGKTPLDFARHEGHAEVVRLLEGAATGKAAQPHEGYQVAPPPAVVQATGSADPRQKSPQAEHALRAAMSGESIPELQEAIENAKTHNVNREVLIEAREALLALKETAAALPVLPAMKAHRAKMQEKDLPMGLKIKEVCDRLFRSLQNPEEDDGTADDELRAWCRQAKAGDAPSILKQSIFGLMTPDEIKHFLLSPDNNLWHEIAQFTEEFLQLLQKAPVSAYSAEELTPETPYSKRLQRMQPVVMDQTVREPATYTPFGHTGYMKLLSLRIVRAMGFKDIAITGQYYKDSYTPETQILEEMEMHGEKMDGTIAMFGPSQEDRKAGVAAMKKFKIPNAFLDTTMKSSQRFADANFVTSVLEAVEEVDVLFKEMGLPDDPWRDDNDINRKPGSGEVSLNLVDLMEFLDLKNDGSMDQEKKAQAEEAFATWKRNPIFRRRVVAILTEEGRGCAHYLDYGHLVKWLRKHFPEEEKFRILVHAHGGDGNTQDAASVEAVLHGGNGVWAAVIPHAAQQGHNSSMVFLDNMLQLGNKNVLQPRHFKLFQAVQCARHCYYLNFNTYKIENCPIWGKSNRENLHTAFRTDEGEEWRRRRTDVYNQWDFEERAEFGKYHKKSSWHSKVREVRHQNYEHNKKYRLSPLVSDAETWRRRIAEARILTAEDGITIGDIYLHVRSLGFALMNANIRVNLDEKETLAKLVKIAKRHYEALGTMKSFLSPYAKAKQHQGDDLE